MNKPITQGNKVATKLTTEVFHLKAVSSAPKMKETLHDLFYFLESFISDLIEAWF